MRDDFYTPAWADNRGQLHAELSALIHKLFGPMHAAFVRLNAIEFDAPWRPRPHARIASGR